MTKKEAQKVQAKRGLAVRLRPSTVDRIRQIAELAPGVTIKELLDQLAEHCDGIDLAAGVIDREDRRRQAVIEQLRGLGK